MDKTIKLMCTNCDGRGETVNDGFFGHCEVCDGKGYLEAREKNAYNTKPTDNINPDHYRTGGIETIEYIKSKMPAEAFEGYLQGNVIKYISRYRNKNGIEDLHKAEWYLTRLIKEVQE